jgi:inorganic pyrophosphatase
MADDSCQDAGVFLLRLGRGERKWMIDDYLQLPIGDEAPETLTAVVEIPLDSVNKYEYDKALHVFRLDRNLYSPVHYPGEYGFIPQTLAQDGDPLDILILGDSPTFPGCVFKARPIGLFDMLDQGVPDEKIVALALGNPRARDIENYTDVMPHILREIEHFFSVYKSLEGKRTEVLGWKDRESAYEVIRASHERFLSPAAVR